MEPTNSDWTSLEIVKLCLSALTPIIGGFIAWKLAKVGNVLNVKIWLNQKVIEKRLTFYEKVMPSLNDMYCYYCYIGNWKELTPKDMIDNKRELDKHFHIYAYIFNETLLDSYSKFISNCFTTYTGWGNDAKIKSKYEKRERLNNWKTEWKSNFNIEDVVKSADFKESYNHLIIDIRKELGILELY